jgi:hypothetical protein
MPMTTIEYRPPQRRHQERHLTQETHIVRKNRSSPTLIKGIAKLLLKTRGPTESLKNHPQLVPLTEASFIRGLGRPCRFRKEKRTNGKLPSSCTEKCRRADNRFSQLHGEFAETPAAKWMA